MGDNWGRWGAEDERGALNLLTPEVVLNAARTCRTGVVYSLGLPVQGHGVPIVPYRGAPMRLTLLNNKDDQMFTDMMGAKDVGANEDMLVFASHNGSHIDALCHVHHEAHFYNGFSADTMRTNGGAGRCGIDKMPWLVGRAVLLDVAASLGVESLPDGHLISAAELEACVAAQQTPVRPGDMVLLHTGWLERFRANPMAESAGQPGIGMEAARLLTEWDIASVGADNSAIEGIPFDGGVFLCVHIELLVRHGIPLMENLVLGQMARDRAYETMLVVAPLQVTGGTGSPINPIAIA